MSRTAVMLAERLDAPLRTLVIAACARAGLEALFVSAQGGTVLPATDTVGVVIAALAPGERSVPAACSRVVASLGGTVPVLLLCHDALVKPVVSLDNGHLRLLGSPLAIELVVTQLRELVPSAPVVNSARLCRDAARSKHVQAREYRGPGWWAATLWNRTGAEAMTPRVHLADGFSAALATGMLAADAFTPLATVDETAERRFTQFAKHLDGGAALWFDALAMRWHISTPADCGLWLHSPRRLPCHWRMPTGIAYDYEAAGDDLMVALRGGVHDRAVDLATEHGGPALLEHLENRMDQDPDLRAAVIVELRP